MPYFQLFQITAILLTGLLAGLFYGYQCSVIGGLSQLDAKTYLMAFKAINKAILNPWFFISFMGSLLVLPVTSCLSYRVDVNASFYFLLSSTMVYIIGVFGLTLFGNVPLNNMIEHFNISKASIQEIVAQRKYFELQWNRLHLIRTIASILSFLLCILSFFKIK